MKKVYVLLADGFETIEALTPVDILHRCGVEVCTVAIGDCTTVKSSHKVTVEADMLMGDGSALRDGDALVLPGGYPGYVNLCNSPVVGELARYYYESGKLLAAICGGPTVLKRYGIATGKNITCHSSVEAEMADGYNLTRSGVCQDGNLITGKGAGLSLEFAIAIARELVDAATIEKLHHGRQLPL